MMQLDRLTLGRMAKELGFVRDTLEKVSLEKEVDVDCIWPDKNERLYFEQR